MIPKLFHFIWFGSIPDEYFEYYEGWKQKHPEYVFNLWDEVSLKKETSFIKQISQIKENKNIYYDTLSDIARYYLIHKFGGIYCDIDVICVKNITPILEQHKDEISFASQSSWTVKKYESLINNNFIMAPPNQALMLDTYKNSITKGLQQNEQTKTAWFTGPRWLDFQFMNKRVNILPSTFINPIDSYGASQYNKHNITENTYGIHRWNSAKNKNNENTKPKFNWPFS